MKVGILGSGTVGQTLGSGFTSHGHAVTLGTRDPANNKITAWASRSGERARVGTFAEAAAFGDVLVLATAWSGTENAIGLAGADRFAGKVLIDVTNPLEVKPGQPPRLAIGHTTSGGEEIQRWLPQARVVKCWNIVTSAFMVDPDLPGGPPDMFICGNDADAKRTVTEILRDFGWPAIDMGGIEASRLLEPLAMLWINYGFRTNSWSHAFKLLRA